MSEREREGGRREIQREENRERYKDRERRGKSILGKAPSLILY